jgi:hypothetical protein
LISAPVALLTAGLMALVPAPPVFWTTPPLWLSMRNGPAPLVQMSSSARMVTVPLLVTTAEV